MNYDLILEMRTAVTIDLPVNTEKKAAMEK